MEVRKGISLYDIDQLLSRANIPQELRVFIVDKLSMTTLGGCCSRAHASVQEVF